METIYDILIREHKIVADLFQQALRDNSRESLLKIKAETDPHMAGEEKLFYPELEKKEELRDLVNHAYEEHDEARSLMSELENMKEGDKNWASKLKELKESIDHHVEEEESKVFEEARKAISQKKAGEIAQQYLEFKQSFKEQMPASMR
ncbi:MAG: hemerythrin domain-containing protein [Methanosarcina sp.]|jgi:hemerythrin-like domain-containing protein